MKTTYLISGLGVDERAFQFLNLEGLKIEYISWIMPEENDDLRAYSNRLLQQIDEKDEVNLVGLSFGGIVAQEIAHLIDVNKIILISSIKSAKELSWNMKLVKALRLNRMTPPKLLKKSSILLADYFFGVESPNDSKLLKDIIKQTDENFLDWAIEAIMKWEREYIDENLTQIHGTKDRIFPINKIQGALEIDGGGHFMVVNRADEISRILKRKLL